MKGALKFPTATFGPFNSAVTPVGSPITSSQTPPPAGTETATVTGGYGTPTSTGGGTNTAQFICTGTGNGITWTFSPCPLVHGQGGSLTISAPAYKNTYTNIIASFGACPAGNCTIDDPPSGSFHTDANGIEVISFTVAGDVQVGGPPVTGEINLSGGPTAGINTVGSVT